LTIRTEWVVLDTNVWIFGLRRQPEYPACAELLGSLNRLRVKIPRQILWELQANLSDEEMHELFRLLNRYQERIDIQWDRVDPLLVEKHQRLGCKLGDAVVAAHLEALGIKTIVSENRHFLSEIQELPFRILNSSEALLEVTS
jgi:predicted nucleic acid-binding protein